MNPRYVSDLIEDIFPSSKEVRVLVRDEVKSRIQPTGTDVDNVIATVGGKCMGYPAVWFTGAALGLTASQLRELWPYYEGAVLISLSTSLIDDVLDEPGAQGAQTVVAAYLLIFQSLECRNNAGLGHCFREGTKKAVAPFIYSNSFPASQFLEESLDRIGGFFFAIAWQISRALDVDERRRNQISRACQEFGRWTCLLDDIIDARRDYEANARGNLAINAAGRLSTESEISLRWIEILNYRLERVISTCIGAGWTELAHALRLAFTKLTAISQAAATEFCLALVRDE